MTSDPPVPYLCHRSDLHIHPHDPRRPQWLSLLTPLPAGSLLLLTGDLCDCGSTAEYAELRWWITEALARGLRVLALPGNHDFSESDPSHRPLIDAPDGIAYSPDAEARWAELLDLLGLDGEIEWEGALEPCGEPRRWVVCGLRTPLRTGDPCDLARGGVGRYGLARIAACGDRVRDDDRGLLVAGHHSPIDNRLGEELRDPIALVRGLLAAGAVRYYCGHEHVARRAWQGGEGGCEVVCAGAGV